MTFISKNVIAYFNFYDARMLPEEQFLFPLICLHFANCNLIQFLDFLEVCFYPVKFNQIVEVKEPPFQVINDKHTVWGLLKVLILTYSFRKHYCALGISLRNSKVTRL